MRGIGSSEVIGYFWIVVVLLSVGLIWWKVDSIFHRDEVCVLQNGLVCLKKSMYVDNDAVKLDMIISNNLGRWITITGFMCSSETPDPSLGHPQRDFERMNVNVLAGSDFPLSGTCYGPLKGDQFNGIIYIRYEYRDEPYALGNQVIVGNIRGKAG